MNASRAPIERPDLSMMSKSDLVEMMMGCAMSGDESDKQFAKFCADEIKKRKPNAIDAALREPK